MRQNAFNFTFVFIYWKKYEIWNKPIFIKKKKKIRKLAKISVTKKLDAKDHALTMSKIN